MPDASLKYRPQKHCQNPVKLEIEGGEIVEILVEYEWLPPNCHKCSSFGHLDHHCPTVEKWLPKESNADESSEENGEASATIEAT